MLTSVLGCFPSGRFVSSLYASSMEEVEGLELYWFWLIPVYPSLPPSTSSINQKGVPDANFASFNLYSGVMWKVKIAHALRNMHMLQVSEGELVQVLVYPPLLEEETAFMTFSLLPWRIDILLLMKKICCYWSKF